MKASKNKTILLQIPPDTKIPYKCKDGYIVKNEKDIPYHLLVEKINDTIQERSAQFKNEAVSIYDQLEKSDKLKFSFALFNRYFYFKENNLEDFNQHYLYPHAIFYIIDELTIDDFDFIVKILKKLNETEVYHDINQELDLLIKLSPLSRIKSLPKNLLAEIEKRFQYFDKEKKRAEERGFGFGHEHHHILCLKL